MKDFTTKTLARACGVSNRTVENWRRRGQGPEYVKRANGRAYYPYEKTIEFIKKYIGKDYIPLDGVQKDSEAYYNG